MAAVVLTSVWLFAGVCYGVDIKVMTSGGFTAAYNELTPEFERATQNKVVTAYGASMGGAPDSIPSRFQRGEPVDVVILVGYEQKDRQFWADCKPSRAHARLVSGKAPVEKLLDTFCCAEIDHDHAREQQEEQWRGRHKAQVRP